MKKAIALNFQSDFPNLLDLRASFSQSQGPRSQILKGRKIPAEGTGVVTTFVPI